MLTYEILCKMIAGGTEVVAVDAKSIAQAIYLAERWGGVLEVVKVLGTIDREPQVFLAW